MKGFVAPLLNWVLTPALLIYTLVLYVYAAKVLFTWTLPEGGVAIMVFVFCIVCMLAKMLQQLVEKQPFRWFYRSFSWIALPLVLLFWIGTCRRIGEYGLTESRYYLLLSGALMTFSTGDRLEQMLRYDDGKRCILFEKMELLQDGGDLQITEVWVELMLER